MTLTISSFFQIFKSNTMNYQVEVGSQETTVKSEFFDITSIIDTHKLPKALKKVFLGNLTFGLNFSL